MPTQVTSLDSTRQETGHRWPCFLPDGRHFLFVALPPPQLDTYEAYAGCLDSRDTKPIVSSGAAPVYAAPGCLLYVRGTYLVVRRFEFFPCGKLINHRALTQSCANRLRDDRRARRLALELRQCLRQLAR